MSFTTDIYAEIRDGAQRSAAAIVPVVVELVSARSVVDVGCGEGWFAREFARTGSAVVALDESVKEASYVEVVSPVRGSCVDFRPADLSGDAWAYEIGMVPFDLTVCLEVAEHLPPGAAVPFVGTLCEFAPVVLFSAAIPGQGGHGHLNEQWPDYWTGLFAARGYRSLDVLRRLFWENDAVEPWYRQNLLLFAADGHPLVENADPRQLDPPARIVHPAFFESRVSERDAAWEKLRENGIEP